jgi:hypothetical protein
MDDTATKNRRELDTGGKAGNPLLSPAQRATEILFGIIMTLSITAAVRVAGPEGEDTRSLLVAALACNIAWGMVDGAFYLINTLLDRARIRKVVEDLRRAASDEQFRALLSKDTLAGLAERMDAQALSNFRQWFNRQTEPPPTGLGGQDWLAALLIWWLVFASTVPLALPFMFMTDAQRALQVSQVIAIVMLFVLGMRLGPWIGMPRWRTGAVFAAVGVAIGVACIALGG